MKRDYFFTGYLREVGEEENHILTRFCIALSWSALKRLSSFS